VLVITVVGGVLLAVLFDRKFLGQGIARLLVIAPFLSCRRYPRSSGRT
jgi:sorbitol/mannitol transport system permease protein